MNPNIADQEWQGRPWSSEVLSVLTYSVLIALLITAWACIPA